MRKELDMIAKPGSAQELHNIVKDTDTKYRDNSLLRFLHPLSSPHGAFHSVFEKRSMCYIQTRLCHVSNGRVVRSCAVVLVLYRFAHQKRTRKNLGTRIIVRDLREVRRSPSKIRHTLLMRQRYVTMFFSGSLIRGRCGWPPTIMHRTRTTTSCSRITGLKTFLITTRGSSTFPTIYLSIR
jgi:hypothetical protein